MLLFSAPGSRLSQKRAWLLTVPFDMPLRTGPREISLTGTDTTGRTLSGTDTTRRSLDGTDTTRRTLTGTL